MTGLPKKKWIKLIDFLPRDRILDGHRLRHGNRILGYVKSGWTRGFWLTKEPGSSSVTPYTCEMAGVKDMYEMFEKLEIEVTQ